MRKFRHDISIIPPKDVRFSGKSLSEYELILALIEKVNELIKYTNSVAELVYALEKWINDEFINAIDESTKKTLVEWRESGYLQELVEDYLVNLTVATSEILDEDEQNFKSGWHPILDTKMEVEEIELYGKTYNKYTFKKGVSNDLFTITKIDVSERQNHDSYIELFNWGKGFRIKDGVSGKYIDVEEYKVPEVPINAIPITKYSLRNVFSNLTIEVDDDVEELNVILVKSSIMKKVNIDDAFIDLYELMSKLEKDMIVFEKWVKDYVSNKTKELEENVDEKISVLEKHVDEKISVLEKHVDTQVENMRVFVEGEIIDLKTSNNMLIDYNKKTYGELEIPNTFKEMGVRLYRDVDGVIKHTFTYNDVKREKIYVSEDGRNTGSGTIDDPVSELHFALILAENKSGKYFEILFKENVLKRKVITIRDYDTPITKNIVINFRNAHVSSFDDHEVVSYTNNILKIKTSHKTMGVVDLSSKNVIGSAKVLDKKNSLNDVFTNVDSWWYDGEITHINTQNPDSIKIALSQTLLQFLNIQGGFVGVINANMYNFSSSQPLYATGVGDSQFVVDNIRLFGYRSGEHENGISTNNIRDVFILNSKVANTTRDCFNYHNTKLGFRNSRVFEYNCIGYESGIGSGQDNVSTAHEGIEILRVGTKGSKTDGPLIHDIEGCLSILFDCSVSHSNTSSVNRRVAFKFDHNAEVEMYHCVAGEGVNKSLEVNGKIKMFGNIL